jgi:predicted nucleic acid-binding protein
MRYAIDTNILARSVQENHPMHTVAKESVKMLLQRGEEVYGLAQNLYEFWVTATRPLEQNGLGLTALQAQRHITEFETTLVPMPDIPPVYGEWKRLVAEHTVMGKNAHDARIVAAMAVHGISHMLTFNGRDFKRFRDIITIVEPTDIFQPPSVSP